MTGLAAVDPDGVRVLDSELRDSEVVGLGVGHGDAESTLRICLLRRRQGYSQSRVKPALKRRAWRIQRGLSNGMVFLLEDKCDYISRIRRLAMIE